MNSHEKFDTVNAPYSYSALPAEIAIGEGERSEA